MADKDRTILSLPPATEDYDQLLARKEASTAAAETGLSSLLGHGQLSTVKDDTLTSSDSSRSLAVLLSEVRGENSMSGDPAGAGGEALDHQSRSKGLLKRLGSLLYPRKKPREHNTCSTRKPLQSTRGAGSDLELLFAQAEATLGELLVRAGASFSAKPSSNHRHHQIASSNGGAVAAPSSSCSRAAVGHVRRNSLSRVWQQVGGRVFCGSGHMSGVLEEMDRKGLAPLGQAVYFGDAEEDLMLDEAYWQSLADAMIMRKHHGEAQDSNSADVEGSHGFSMQQESRHQQYGELEEGEEECKSEIVPSVDIIDAACKKNRSQVAVAGGSFDSSIFHPKLIPVGRDTTRLNTTLDDSPNLVHNHQQRVAAARVRGKSRSSSVVDYSPSTAAAEPAPANTTPMQPLEKFLWRTRARGSTSSSSWCDGSAVGPTSSSSSAPRSTPQPPMAEVAGCRVSLMALLHEEKEESEAADSPLPTASASLAPQQQQEEEGKMVRSTLVVEDPLLCCVCMVERKGAALIPCGHTFCRNCTRQLCADRGACPLCNKLIDQVLDIF